MTLTPDTAHATVARWIESSSTTEHLECCQMFIYDTLLRLFPSHDVTGLLFDIDTRVRMIKGE